MRVVLVLLLAVWLRPAYAEDASRYASMSPDEREADVLAKATDVASRDGCRLTLRLKSKGVVRLYNYDSYGYSDGACANPRKADFVARRVDSHAYYLEAYRPDCGLFVVAVQYPENADYILVDARNGRQTTIRGIVDVSPTCRYALEKTPESEAGMDGPDVIRIWRRAGARFVHDWTYLMKDVARPDMQFVRWVNDTKLEFLCELCSKDDVQLQMFVQRERGRWRLVAGREIPFPRTNAP